MERDQRRRQRAVAPRVPVWDERGQATLEYLLVGLVLIVIVGALGALWRFASEGDLGALANLAASHAVESVGGVVDALMF